MKMRQKYSDMDMSVKKDFWEYGILLRNNGDILISDLSPEQLELKEGEYFKVLIINNQ